MFDRGVVKKRRKMDFFVLPIVLLWTMVGVLCGIYFAEGKGYLKVTKVQLVLSALFVLVITVLLIMAKLGIHSPFIIGG